MAVLIPASVFGQAAPSITQQPASQTVLTPTNASFSVTASGQSPLSYQWSFNGTNLNESPHLGGSTHALLTVSNVTPADAGGYTVVVSNHKGSVTSAVATLTVRVPATLLSQPASQTVALTSNASFSVNATGTAPLAYQWYFNGMPLVDGSRIAGSATSNLTVLNLQISDAGNYQVAVSNPYRLVVSSTATLAVSVNGSALVRFVNQSNSQPKWPYTSWFTAATNLQDALDVASAGDQILVSNGVYAAGSRVVGGSSNRVAITLPVAVSSVNGPAWTSIDGGGAMRCVTMADGSSLSGFTLTNGMSSEHGGGVRCDTTNAVVSNCVFVANSAYIQGGGAYQGTLLNCLFTNNSAAGVDQGYPAGGAAGSSVLKRCLITGNVTADYGEGGGLYGCLADQCILSSNSAPLSFAGGASHSTLNNCLLVGNYAGSYGGGAESCTLNNCTVVNNTAYLGAGGGINNSTANNCIIYSNALAQPTALGIPPDQTNCADSTVNYSCTTPLLTNGVGNLSTPPGFVNLAAGDFRLLPTSPCINAGHNSFITSPTDLDGNPRLIGPTVDMGAYEDQAPTIAILSQPLAQSKAQGQTAAFSVSAQSPYPLTYQWLFNGLPLSDGPYLAGSTTASLTLSNLQATNAGNYSVQIANTFLSVTSAVASLAVILPPTFIQQPTNQTVVVGSNATFSAAATGTTLSYRWFFNGLALSDNPHQSGTHTNTLNLASAQPADAGNYSLVISNALGSVTSAVATLTVLVPPGFTQQPLSQAVAVGANATLTAVATGTSLAYQWYFNDTPLTDSAHVSGSLTSALNLFNVQEADAGTYYLVIQNSLGTLTSSVATITVQVPPSFTQQPLSQVIGLGSNVTFSATANGTALAYQWLFNGSPLTDSTRINGSLTSSLSLSNVQSADGGSYALLISNAVGTATSSAATLTVVIPPAITGQPVGRSVPAGVPTTFTASASGSGPLAYRWQLNGTDIPGATSSSYTIAAVGTTNLGAYHLVVRNAAGAAVSAEALLTFGPVAAWGQNTSQQCLPPPGLSNVIAISGGDTYSLALRADGTVVAWGSPRTTLLPAGLTNIVAVSASTTDAGLALRADGTLVAWNSSFPFPVSVSNQTAIASGFRYALGLNWAGVVQGWPQTNSGTVAIQAGTPPPGLTKVSAMAAGVAPSFALRADGRVVAWGSGAGTNVPTNLTNAIAVGAGCNHGLALRADGTVAAWGATTATNVPPGLTNVAAIAAGGYAQGNGESMAVLSNGLVRAWGDNTFGQSTVPAGLTNVVAGAFGAYHTLALVSDGSPLLQQPPVGGTAYAGSSVTLAGLASGAAPLSYQWLFDGTNLPGATSRSLTLNNLQPGNAGTYQLLVSNALGSVTSVAAPLTIVDSAPFFVQMPARTNVAPVGYPITIGTAVAGSGPLQLQWQCNGHPVPGATTDTLSFNFLRRTNAGPYTLVASNSFGVVTSTVAMLWPATVTAWGVGNTFYGQTNVPLTLTNGVAVAASAYNSVALRADGAVWGWGLSFQYSAINLPTFTNVVEISAGLSSVLGLTTQGTVVGYGIQPSYLAGLSNIVALETDSGGSTFLRPDGTLARLSGSLITYPPGGTNVLALASALSSYAALRADGTVLYNNVVQTPTNVLGMAFAGGPTLYELFLKRDGSVQGVSGLGVPPGLSNALDVALIQGTGILIQSNGAALMAGQPQMGTPPPPALTNLTAVEGGNSHFVALLSEQPFPRVLLPAALNTPAFVVSSKDSPQWFGQSAFTHDGMAAAQSAPIERNTQSSMRTLVTGPVLVSFWWKVSSQTNHHTLAFSVGGNVQTNISGEVDWQPCTVAVPAGPQMLQWTFAKDDSASAGLDAAWVDQLVITPVPPTILAQPASLTVRGGSNVVLGVSATGTPPLRYAWFKNGATPVGANSPGLVFLNAMRTNSGTYFVVVTNLAGSITSSNAVLLVHVPQLLGTPMRQADGTLVFTSQDVDGGLLSADSLASLQVQFSTNLVDWVPLAGNASLTNGLLQVQDLEATNSPARFYRAVESW